jgi:hypothetical protein
MFMVDLFIIWYQCRIPMRYLHYLNLILQHCIRAEVVKVEWLPGNYNQVALRHTVDHLEHQQFQVMEVVMVLQQWQFNIIINQLT